MLDAFQVIRHESSGGNSHSLLMQYAYTGLTLYLKDCTQVKRKCCLAARLLSSYSKRTVWLCLWAPDQGSCLWSVSFLLKALKLSQMDFKGPISSSAHPCNLRMSRKRTQVLTPGRAFNFYRRYRQLGQDFTPCEESPMSTLKLSKASRDAL